MCFCMPKEEVIEQKLLLQYHNNLLQDIPLLIYKEKISQNMKNTEPNEHELMMMVDDYMKQLSPQERIQIVAEQSINLVRRMWSPILTADLAPGTDPD